MIEPTWKDGPESRPCENCGRTLRRANSIGECETCEAECCDICGHYIGENIQRGTILHCAECGSEWFRCDDCHGTRLTGCQCEDCDPAEAVSDVSALSGVAA